jgi:hypothetical protein
MRDVACRSADANGRKTLGNLIGLSKHVHAQSWQRPTRQFWPMIREQRSESARKAVLAKSKRDNESYEHTSRTIPRPVADSFARA